MSTKAYKIELLIIDNEDIGIVDIKEYLRSTKHVYPQIKSVEEADIGEWHEDHPLNKRASADAEYERIFNIKK